MNYYEFNETEEYQDWFGLQPLKTRAIVAKIIKNIINYGHFGDFKNVSKYDKGLTKDVVFELR